MQALSLSNLVLAAILLVWIIKKQLTPRVVQFKSKTYLIIMLIGVFSINDAVTKHALTITPTQLLLFAGGSLLSAAIFGGLRAWSYRLWLNQDSLVMRQGNWLTLLFWILGIGSHLLVDQIWTNSSVTLLLYLGLTLMIQRGGIWWRAQRNYPTELAHNLAVQTHHDHHHH